MAITLEQVREKVYAIRTKFEAHRNGLPDEWQDWAQELVSDLSKAVDELNHLSAQAKVRVDTGNLVSDPLYLALDALYERGWSDSEKRKHDPRGTNEWQAVLDLFRVHAARLSQGAQSSGNSGEVAGVSQGDQDEAVAEVIGDDRSTGGRRLIWHSTVALLRTPAGTKLYTHPAERSAVPDGLAYWAAVDDEGDIVHAYNAVDGNSGEVARMEMNEWINDRLNDGGPLYRLVALSIIGSKPCKQSNESTECAHERMFSDMSGLHHCSKCFVGMGSPSDYPECSGNPSDCPENEGYGCCKKAAPQPPEGARVVPPTITKTVCDGCPHLNTKWWKDYLDNDETDCGTSAHCMKANRSITAYWHKEDAPPSWCPLAAPTLAGKEV